MPCLFLFSILMLWNRGLDDSRGTANQPIQSPHPQPPPPYSHTQSSCCPALITPGLATRPHWNYLSQIMLNLFTLPHWFLFAETTVKALANIPPYSLCLWLTPCFPVWSSWWGVPFPLGIREYNKFLFSWQSSPDLLALPYLNNNETCILKYSWKLQLWFFFI